VQTGSGASLSSNYNTYYWDKQGGYYLPIFLMKRCSHASTLFDAYHLAV